MLGIKGQDAAIAGASSRIGEATALAAREATAFDTRCVARLGARAGCEGARGRAKRIATPKRPRGGPDNRKVR
jgi:hypothetical protein